MIALPQIPPRYRRALVWAGYPLWAVVVAMLTFYVSVPRDRVKEKIESNLAADPTTGVPLAIGMDATIEDVALTMLSGLGVKATSVALRSRPVNPSDKPMRLFIDDVTVHVGLFGLLFNRPTYRFKAHGLSGAVNGEVYSTLDESRLRLDLENVVLTGAQVLAQALGLPLEGSLSGKLEINEPKNLAANAVGNIEFTIEDAAVGDGKAKLTVPGDPFLAQGVTVPRLKLGRVHGEVILDKGRARFEGLSAHSADGDVMFDGYVELHDPLTMSQMHGYLRFRPSEALISREVTLKLLTDAVAATGKRTDGYIGFQMTGPLMALFLLPSKDAPAGVSLGAGAAAPAPALPPRAAALPPPVGTPNLSPTITATPPPMPSRGEPEEPPPPRDREPPPPMPPSPSPVRATLNKALEELNRHEGEGPAPAPSPSQETPQPAPRGE